MVERGQDLTGQPFWFGPFGNIYHYGTIFEPVQSPLKEGEIRCSTGYFIRDECCKSMVYKTRPNRLFKELPVDGQACAGVKNG